MLGICEGAICWREVSEAPRHECKFPLSLAVARECELDGAELPDEPFDESGNLVHANDPLFEVGPRCYRVDFEPFQSLYVSRLPRQ